MRELSILSLTRTQYFTASEATIRRHAPVVCPNGTAVFARDVETSQQVWSAEVGYPGDAFIESFTATSAGTRRSIIWHRTSTRTAADAIWGSNITA